MRFTAVTFCVMAAVLCAGTAFGASPAGAARFSAYAHVEQFKWEEDFRGGDLEESGPLYGLGGTVTLPLTDTSLEIEGRAEFFFGDVDYEGGVQNEFGEIVADLDTETEYRGITIEGDVAYSFPLQNDAVVKPLFGLGIKSWSREIGSRYGYDEDWTSLYAILGVRGTRPVNATVGLFGTLALRYALYNKAEYSGVPMETTSGGEVEPGKEASFYLELGAQMEQWMVAVFYETLEFSESDVDNGLMQPDSEAAIYGLRGGMTF